MGQVPRVSKTVYFQAGKKTRNITIQLLGFIKCTFALCKPREKKYTVIEPGSGAGKHFWVNAPEP